MAGPGFEWIGEEEEREVLDVLRTKWLFRYGEETDPRFKRKVMTFEQEICDRFDTKHSLAVSTGTAALLTAFAATGIGPGDEVIVPGYTFVASIASIVIARAVPILAEVDRSLTLDPADVERKITPRTKAILAVHMLGNPCDMSRLQRVAEKHGLMIIEDACQAFGGSYGGRRLGTIGRLGAYSFNIFKTVNAGDGGMVVTDDDELYFRAFGYHDQGHFPGRYGTEITNRAIIGQDFRMNELTGAVLLAQARKVDRILERLHALKSELIGRIEGFKGIELRKVNDVEGECATVLVFYLPSKEVAEPVAEELGTITLARSGWHIYSNMEHLLSKKTVTSEGCPFACPLYKGEVEYHRGMLPVTDGLAERAIGLSVGVVCKELGTGFGVNIDSDEEDIDRVVRALKTAIEKHV